LFSRLICGFSCFYQSSKQSSSPETVIKPIKKPTLKKGDSSSGEDSSSSDREVEKIEESSRKKGSASSASEDDQESKDKKRKDKKKKKDKKHKKHKKHKKLKKSKQKGASSSDDDEDEENESDEEGGADKHTVPEINPSIAKSFIKLVQPENRSPEDLERKLREKALESMKKAASINR
jgi:hypothetical protein